MFQFLLINSSSKQIDFSLDLKKKRKLLQHFVSKGMFQIRGSEKVNAPFLPLVLILGCRVNLKQRTRLVWKVDATTDP